MEGSAKPRYIQRERLQRALAPGFMPFGSGRGLTVDCGDLPRRRGDFQIFF